MSLTKMRNTLTVAILFVCLKTGSGLLSQKPQDSVTVAGKSTYFNCSTSEPSKRIQWYHYDVNEAQREAIYRCDNFTEYWYPCYRKGRYVVERNQAKGAYNLVIPTVVSSDAGRFLCEVDGDEGMANLTVRVESNPTCVASEICEPYIKPYSDAIVCFFLIILPTAIGGTVFVLWYLRVYRPRKLKQTGQKERRFEDESVNKEDDAKTKMVNTNESSQENEIQGVEEETRELNPAAQEECNNGQDIKIKTLENALKVSLERIDRRDKAINDLRQNDESNKAKIYSLQFENAQLQDKATNLQDKVKDLEQSLYPKGNIDYAEKPTLAQIIITDGAAKEPRKPINGMTILGKELFVLHENSSTIEVFDSETFKLVHNWVIEGMSHPMDVASCKNANCLYVILREDNTPESQIMKLEPRGKLITKWSTGGDSGRLSVYESNVIVCLFEQQQIDEYTRDGIHIHTVRLSPGDGFNHPWHAIKVTSSHFVVCHGEARDELHRVCIVDVQGIIIKKLGQGKSPKLNVPICLVEDSERSILVADRGNKKIRLLNCFLKCERSLIKQDSGSDQYPVRICLDETKGRLFIAENTTRSNKKDWKNGRIVMFNIRKVDG